MNILPDDIYYEINNYLNNKDSKNFENVLNNINKNFRFEYKESIEIETTDDFTAIYINDKELHEYYQSNNFLSLISNIALLKFILIPDIPINKKIETIKIRDEIQKIIIKSNDNEKICEFNFKNFPLITGDNITYFNNMIISNYKYNNGKLEGESNVYHENGNVFYKEIYKNGNLDGERQVYFEDGTTIKNKQFFNNGNKINKWYEYYENGNIKSITNYENNKKQGIQLYYHENKNLYRHEKYNNDQLIYSLVIPYEDSTIYKIDIDIN